MSERISYQTINENGVPRYAVVPFEDFRQLLAAVDEADPTIPHAVISATVDGMSPIRAWREYLGFSQSQVAEAMAISQSAYSQMESSTDRLRSQTLGRISEALGIDAAQLDF